MAVSLLLSGALTWVLVRDVELQGAQDELDRTVIVDAALVRHLECQIPIGVATNAGPAGCRLADASFFAERIASVAGADRLILLSRSRQVVYDSGGSTIDQQLAIQASRRVAGVAEATPQFEGQTYLAAAFPIVPTRDPLGAAYVVLARAQSSVAAAAAGELLPRLLVAGGVALLVALALVLILSRSVTRPLSQLAGAAEDIADGNYSRRVGIRGPDEIGLLGASFDRMAEGVENARRVQRDFLANVSHELKTPLTSLIGFSQALIDGSLKTDAEQRRAAQIVHEESERVLRMAQELLDLARVEAGTISMHITAVDLAGQVEQEVEIVRPRASIRELTLTSDLDGLPPVAADPERLHQVLGNLLDNAVKYAPAATAVHMAARAEGSTVELQISNATGADRPDPEMMFNRFYRADASRSAAAGGVGLGLAISRELIAAMGGRLWADFRPDGDVVLHVALPAEARDASAREVSAPAVGPR
ncbi:MAG TPA: HAMP domain-containing sensor histidine kinase [Candidatus Dormibacteraeota bacterium]|nr:HAMP domain-containing sensor histidine kinase [Candidatus Dormibacteraeota bacterium]